MVLLAQVGTAPGAQAGTYNVVSCASAPGFVNNAWTSSVSGSGTTSYACPPGSGMAATVGSASTAVFTSELSAFRAAGGPGGTARWDFTAPAGTSLQSFSGTWRCAVYGFAHVTFASPSGGSGTGTCTSSGFSAVSRTFPAGATMLQLIASLSCNGSQPGCMSSSGQIALGQATVTLVENGVPALNVTGGSIPAGGWHDHTADIRFDAADNVGIRAATLSVDGTERARRDFPCDFTRPVPCSNQPNQALSFDTAGLSEGTHNARLTIVDAAGNQTHYDRPLRVDTGGPELDLSGRLWELQNNELLNEDYPVSIYATDGSSASASTTRSGVAKIEVYLDGALKQTTTQPQPGDNATLQSGWSLSPNAAALEPGPHSMRVLAEDRVGHATERAWTVYVADIEPLPTEQELLDESIEFREATGLRRDEPYVRSLLNNRAYTPAREDFSVPLTPEEVAELDRREDTADADSEVITAYGEDQAPAAWAGSYTDPASGFTYVGFTSNLDSHLAALRANVTHPGVLQGFGAARTLADLHALADRVDNDAPVLELHGIKVLMSELDVQLNQLVLGTDAELNEAQRTYLRDTYGPGVTDEHVTVEPLTSPPRRTDRHDTLLAGLGISSSRHACTSGFTHKDAAVGGGVRGVFTAGHCADLNGEEWVQGGDSIGEVVFNEVYTRGRHSADVAVIGDFNDRARRVAPAIYETRYRSRLVSRVQRLREARTGARVCLSGLRSGYDCGFVSSMGNNVDIRGVGGQNVRLKDQIYVRDMRCVKGDSGAPIYRRVTAMGLLSALITGRRGTRCSYSHIAHVQGTTNVPVYTSE